MSAQFTPGPWHACNHFADDTTPCTCAFVLSDGYAGSICQISVDNGRNIADGGNDSPPLAEAAANGRLIAAAPELYDALEEALKCLRLSVQSFPDAERKAARAVAKARGDA